jgi:hypothetical protein
MNKKRVIGFSMVIISTIIALSNIPLTGNVIGPSASSYISIIAVGLFIGGIVMIFASGLETMFAVEKGIVVPSEAARRANNIAEGKKKSMILDTSILRTYNQKGARRFFEQLKDYEYIIAPNSVYEVELASPRFSDLKKMLDEEFNVEPPMEGFEQYKGMARAYLQQTEKPQMRLELLPYLSGKKKISSAADMAKVKRLSSRVQKIMENEGYDVAYATGVGAEAALARVMDYLDTHCAVSGVDVDVLAAAMAEAMEGNQAVIAGKDLDFRGAVNLIKGETKSEKVIPDPRIGPKIHYFEPWKSAPAMA